VLIREAAIDDVPAFDRIRRQIYPWLVSSVAAQRHWYTSVTPAWKAVRPVAIIDGEAAQRFAAERGFRQGHSDRYCGVDPRHLPPTPDVPEGVQLVPVSSQTPEAMHALDSTAGADEPGDVSFDGLSLDEWMERVWHGPDQSYVRSQD
jgi:hypothetical protein